MSEPQTPLKDYYRILDVPRTASAEEIKERYRQLALDLHPDRCADKASIERFKAVSEAYRVLNDSGKRGIIDEYLEQRRFTGARLRADESFMDRLAGVERPAGAGGRNARARGGGGAKAFRFLEIALSPRVLMIGGGLCLMSYIAFGSRDNLEEDGMLVPAWFNQRTKRWETPAPWDPEYRRSAGTNYHGKVNKYHVFQSSPPSSSAGPPSSSSD